MSDDLESLRPVDDVHVLRRPLVGIVLVMLLGTLAGLLWPVTERHATHLLAAAAVLWCVCLACSIRSTSTRVRRLTGSLSIALALGLLAGVHASLWATAQHDPGMEGYLERKVEIIGIVASDPQRYSNPGGAVEQWRFDIGVESIRCVGEAWTPTHERVDVLWFNRVDGRPPVYGQRVSILDAKLRARTYKKRHGTRFRIATGSGGTVVLGEKLGSPWRDWCFRMRSKSAAHLTAGVSDFPREVGLMHALLLGYRASLDKVIRDMAAATGTVHIFAISGLHVGIVVGLIVFVLNACRIPRTHWIWVLLPVLTAYTMMTGARASAVRACIMAIIYFAASGVGRRADVPSAVAAAALAIVLWEPGQLLDMGFIFSFTVVVGLIVFCPIFWQWLAPWTGRDALRAPVLEGAGDRVAVTVRQYVAGLFTVSLAAWLISTPLTAHFFGRITPIGLLGNLFVIPVTFLLVLSGATSMLLGALLPWVGEIFNHTSLALAKLLIELLDIMVLVPFGQFEVAPWPLWSVGLAYVVLAASGAALNLRCRRAIRMALPEEREAL
ncbi:MAG: ComEC/Rec2-related protein [Kiritimatiellia bacterium]